jgi:hypothetical protein
MNVARSPAATYGLHAKAKTHVLEPKLRRALTDLPFVYVIAVLLGPLQSLTYLLNSGMLAATLGAVWVMRAHWSLTVPIAALVRVAGTLLYLVLYSWTMNENLFALLMTTVYALLVPPCPVPMQLFGMLTSLAMHSVCTEHCQAMCCSSLSSEHVPSLLKTAFMCITQLQ